MSVLRTLFAALALAFGFVAPGQAATWKIVFFSDATPTVQVGEGTFVPNIEPQAPDVFIASSWNFTVNGVAFPNALSTPPTLYLIGGTASLGFALEDATGLLILASTEQSGTPPNGTTQFWETENCGEDDCPKTASGTFTLTQLSDEPAVIPLPATAALLPLGLGALAVVRRRKAKG
jgi:hypothetical protein